MKDHRVSLATPLNKSFVSDEVSASFKTVFECPHCGTEQAFNGIARTSGVVRCIKDYCQREFRLNVPPYDSQFVCSAFIHPQPRGRE